MAVIAVSLCQVIATEKDQRKSGGVSNEDSKKARGTSFQKTVRVYDDVMTVDAHKKV